MEWLGQKQHRQHGLAEQAALRSVFAPPGAPQVQSVLCARAPSTAASSSSLLTYLRMPLCLLTRHQEAKGTILGEDCCLSPPPRSIRRADAGPLPSCLCAQCRKPGAGNEKSPPEEPCAIFPASPSAPASRSPPQTHTHTLQLCLSLAGHREGPMVLAPRCWLPGTLARPSCQAFQGSLSLSRGWKCRAGDRLPWQPHCFQTLKGRERKVGFSRLTKATTSVDAGQAVLKITAVLPDTRASRGQKGTMHTKGDNPGQQGRSGAGERKWGFFLHSPFQQVKEPVISLRCKPKALTHGSLLPWRSHSVA